MTNRPDSSSHSPISFQIFLYENELYHCDRTIKCLCNISTLQLYWKMYCIWIDLAPSSTTLLCCECLKKKRQKSNAVFLTKYYSHTHTHWLTIFINKYWLTVVTVMIPIIPMRFPTNFLAQNRAQIKNTGTKDCSP